MVDWNKVSMNFFGFPQLNFISPLLHTPVEAGSMTQFRFPMVSLEFFIDRNNSGRTMALASTQPLTEMSARNVFWGRKGGRCVRLTILPSSYADCLELLKLQPRGMPWAWIDLYRDCFTLYLLLYCRFLMCTKSWPGSTLLQPLFLGWGLHLWSGTWLDVVQVRLLLRITM
jgi:hypothetical protein